MRILTLIISFLLFSNLEMKAQDYTPFPTDSAVWTQSNYHFHLASGWMPEFLSLGGDTLINDVVYKKIHSNETQYRGALREDDEKRIWFKPHSSIIDEENPDYIYPVSFPVDSLYLLYDFNDIQIGDTIKYENSENHVEFGYNYLVVSQFQDVIGGEVRNVYQMITPYQIYSIYPLEYVYFIEGIGSSEGLLAPWSTMPWESIQNSMVTCYEDTALYWGNTYHLSDLVTGIVDCVIINTSIQELSSSSFSIYPNPTSDKLFIESSGSPIQSVQVYSQSGKQVYSDSDLHSRSLELDLSKLDSGLYFVQIIDASGVITQKLVKE